VLRIVRSAQLEMIRHAIAGLPDEACGLLGGPVGGDLITTFVPTRNADSSAKTYSIGADGFLAADQVLSPLGADVVGVMHSHTHTDPYPSPTDVRQAADPAWIYVIVSLKHGDPSLRAYSIVDATITELGVELLRG
jgi:[CysO sulfur-carrier protein]-S-L-cysteine hydrolase